jgi:hypothetical protein
MEVVLAGGVRQGEQHGGVGDPGQFGQCGVVADFGEQPGQRLGAGVVFAEEVGFVAMFVPAAIAVGAGVFAPGGLAAAFGPPGEQPGGRVGAGVVGQRGEQVVGADEVVEFVGVGEREGTVEAIAERGDGLPAVVDLVTAGKALGIGRTKTYALARSGDFPCRILRIGNTYRVPTPELLTLLGYPGGAPRPEPEGE